MSKYCSECGGQVLTTDVFCTNCGSKLRHGNGALVNEPKESNSQSDTKQEMISFNDSIVKAYKKYAMFTGRATRAEYWFFVLFQAIIYAVLGLLFFVGSLGSGTAAYDLLSGITGLIAVVFYFATLIPSLALAVRRVHDVGFTGWILLLYLIPYIGPLVVIFGFLITQSDVGENKYGVPSAMEE